jgi:AcrR family transcriptional regulator
MGKKPTREKLLDAAEELFADRGFVTTSVRAITEKAGVNLAALNYHFGSKAGLIEAVFKRRIDPINIERLELLKQFEVEAGTHPVSLERIMEAFLAPAIILSRKNSPPKLFIRLMGRIHMESNSLDSGMEEISEIKRNIMLNFKEVFSIFRDMLARALPEVEPEELLWRLSFNLGAMAHTMMMVHGQQVNPVSEALASMDSAALLSDDNEEKVLGYLIRYTAAGMRAVSG